MYLPALIASAAIAAAGFLLRVVFKRRKLHKQYEEMSQIKRRNEALNEALRNPLMKGGQGGPEGPMEVSWDDKAVQQKAAAPALMVELMEFSAYSRRKYVFRADQPIRIGSGEANQLVLPREGVAREHCQICMNGALPCVKSFCGTKTILKRGRTSALVSAEGVYLNDGDRIQVGESVIQFRLFKA